MIQYIIWQFWGIYDAIILPNIKKCSWWAPETCCKDFSWIQVEIPEIHINFYKPTPINVYFYIFFTLSYDTMAMLTGWATFQNWSVGSVMSSLLVGCRTRWSSPSSPACSCKSSTEIGRYTCTTDVLEGPMIGSIQNGRVKPAVTETLYQNTNQAGRTFRV